MAAPFFRPGFPLLVQAALEVAHPVAQLLDHLAHTRGVISDRLQETLAPKML
jgi:hypothetical protein